jgi:hypothetical protein
MTTLTKILTAGLLALTLTACGAQATSEPPTAGPTDVPGTPAPSPTITPIIAPSSTPGSVPETAVPGAMTPTPELTVAAPEQTAEPLTYGDKTYETDFMIGWPDLPTERGTVTSTTDGYLFEVDSNWALWTFTTQASVAEFYAEVSVVPRTCPAGDSAYGLMFHYVNGDKFRFFSITCGGDYLLFDRNLPAGTVLASGELPAEIDPGTGNHTLGVKVLDGVIIAYVDGTEIARAEVEETPEGDLGLYAQTEADAISILFTRLRAYRPQ